MSAMTKQQYLDALSAPRVDPTNQGRKVMISKPHFVDESSDEASEEEKPTTRGKGKVIKGEGKTKEDEVEIAEEEGNGEGVDKDAEQEME